MAGLVPAIHVFVSRKQDVDARHKAGHDECIGYCRRTLEFQLNTPTIAPIRQVVSVPDTIDFNPS